MIWAVRVISTSDYGMSNVTRRGGASNLLTLDLPAPLPFPGQIPRFRLSLTCSVLVRILPPRTPSMKLVTPSDPETLGSAAYRIRFPLRATTAGRSVGIRPKAEATGLQEERVCIRPEAKAIGLQEEKVCQRIQTISLDDEGNGANSNVTLSACLSHLNLAPSIQQNVKGCPSLCTARLARACHGRQGF